MDLFNRLFPHRRTDYIEEIDVVRSGVTAGHYVFYDSIVSVRIGELEKMPNLRDGPKFGTTSFVISGFALPSDIHSLPKNAEAITFQSSFDDNIRCKPLDLTGFEDLSAVNFDFPCELLVGPKVRHIEAPRSFVETVGDDSELSVFIGRTLYSNSNNIEYFDGNVFLSDATAVLPEEYDGREACVTNHGCGDEGYLEILSWKDYHGLPEDFCHVIDCVTAEIPSIYHLVHLLETYKGLVTIKIRDAVGNHEDFEQIMPLDALLAPYPEKVRDILRSLPGKHEDFLLTLRGRNISVDFI